MQKDRPLLPGIGQGALQFFHVIQYPESALCIRVLEWICSGSGWQRLGQSSVADEVKQCIGCLSWQMFGDVKKVILSSLLNIHYPVLGYADA